ncbi:hypothetical protein SARC_00990 [Sphaeroforma arctica JP610]|uniref:Pirin N-terminal domain-containing protein n=1 Tax=Sphaeroforma arctica JP610 TaxID=667725 RepID=A0A0L0GD03_9EUKA|nr:hypothetical protein SARC_00990 [Sphaeroforma arctica JP610]KNC86895.1 hypothetical protein SARC_00990 [Sphaeroforma arctica JP610]|eukprot:XP_014160797.1 hypothetical protein SARC_00990 [Sphaeroforma arctica JP610]
MWCIVDLTIHTIPSFILPQILSRSVVQSVLSVEQAEGAGARVRRSIGGRQLRNFDPFLMLDEFKVKAPNGFPTHPHWGFETVTYMLQGAVSHEDFAGHQGVIYPGDLQWMTAGRGIMHSEKPYGTGESAGLQLWVNLAKEYRMVKPACQIWISICWYELRSKDISKVEKDGVHIAVIAGKAMDVESVVYTRTPTMYLDVTMQPGSSYSQAIPSDIAYV